MKAGHNHPDSQGWHTSRPWDLSPNHYTPLSWGKNTRETSIPQTDSPPSTGGFPTRYPLATLHHLSIAATGSQSGNRFQPTKTTRPCRDDGHRFFEGLREGQPH